MPNLKTLLPEERPREKLAANGSEHLTNAELLAIILQNGSKKENAIEVSRKLLKNDTIKSLSARQINYLKNSYGIGQAKACKLLACFELAKRIAAYSNQGQTIDSAKHVADQFMPSMSALKQEHVKCVFLNARRKITCQKTIFVGSLDSTIIHPREIFSLALEESAAAIILLHNHPSGNTSPSEKDIEVTKELADAGRILGIELLDHIIIANNSYFSFKEQELL